MATIIGIRTAQTSGVALVALAGLRLSLPDTLFWPAFFSGGALVGSGLSAYFVATFTARLTLPGTSLLVRLPSTTGPDAVALTFDDGPHPETTPRLLDTLAAADGAKATFFLVGERAARYPTLTRRIAEEGHMIGVHGLRHRTMALDTAAAIRRDLAEAVRCIEEATGRPLTGRWLRPPYGFKSITLCRTAAQEGWHLAAWSLDARDYDHGYSTAEALAMRVLRQLAPDDIILLHERPGYAAAADALPEILAGCRARGLRPVSLPLLP